MEYFPKVEDHLTEIRRAKALFNTKFKNNSKLTKIILS